MADTKITALTELAERPAAGDLAVVVDVSDTSMAASGTNKKIQFTNLGSDWLSTLLQAEISITGAVTATISRMHVCTGTSADYTVTLPAASGHAGKFIGIRMGSALTKLVTIDGNASETIDGTTTRVMWANEACILQCDGSNWFKVAGKTIPMHAVVSRNAAQSIDNDTPVKIAIDAAGINIGSIADFSTNDRINIRRAGNYHVSAQWSAPNMDAGERVKSAIQLNGSTLIFEARNYSPATNTPVTAMCAGVRAFAANDYIEMIVEQNEGASQNTQTDEEVRPKMSAMEIPVW